MTCRSRRSVRLLARMNIAMADAVISIWNAKNVYDTWRPITAIQQAGTDGNPDTTADPSWTPLLVTPVFQEYPSGHAGVSQAGAGVLAACLRRRHLVHPHGLRPAGRRTQLHQLLRRRESGVARPDLGRDPLPLRLRRGRPGRARRSPTTSTTTSPSPSTGRTDERRGVRILIVTALRPDSHASLGVLSRRRSSLGNDGGRGREK